MLPRAGARSRFSRLIAELTARPSERDCEEALARLRVANVATPPSGRVADDPALGGPVLEINERDDGRPLAELRDAEARIVRIAPNVYVQVPLSEGRVRLLRLARSAATTGVMLHVAIAGDQSHLGRAVIDAPRRALRAAGFRVAEPGDRFGPNRYAHCFFDEEELLDEIERAGLTVASRRGFSFFLVAADPGAARTEEDVDSFALEVVRTTRLVPAVDRGRKHDPPEVVVAAMRARGTKTGVARGPIGRARLRRAISWVDALGPGGASCYRRILLELALDAGAARETVVFGLDVGRTGHVAFADREERTFDVSFAIPAERGEVRENPDDLDVRGDPAEG